MTLPEYLNKGARLPASGPDRIRFCFWYADARETLEHAEAVEQARSTLRLLYFYRALSPAELLAALGPSAGCVPIELEGETWP